MTIYAIKTSAIDKRISGYQSFQVGIVSVGVTKIFVVAVRAIILKGFACTLRLGNRRKERLFGAECGLLSDNKSNANGTLRTVILRYLTAISLLPSTALCGYFDVVDLSAESLPPRSKEASLGKLFAMLERIKEPEKNEYESYLQYFKRREAWLEQLPYREDRLIAIRLDAVSKYDPEEKRLVIKAGTDNCGHFSHAVKGIKVSSEKTRFEPYVARNALGSAVTVNESTETFYCISASVASFSVSAEPSRARNLKDGFSVIYVGRLQYPYILASDYVSDRPTLNRPYSLHERVAVANFEVKQVLLAEKNTRKVVDKIDSSVSIENHLKVFRRNNNYCRPDENGYIDANGNNELHLLIWRGCSSQAVEMIKLSDPSIFHHKNKFGATPLHLAVSKEDERSIYYLLAAGANPDVKDAQGESPRDLASRKGGRLHRFFN